LNRDRLERHSEKNLIFPADSGHPTGRPKSLYSTLATSGWLANYRKTKAAKRIYYRRPFNTSTSKGTAKAMSWHLRASRTTLSIFLTVASLASALFSAAQSASEKSASQPWTNASLSPDQRASLVLKQMTLDEKISLLHGTGMPGLGPMSALAVHSNGGAGYVVGVARLGIPDIQISDAAYGVRQSGENGRYSTALPSNVGAAASWDLDAAFQYGALIGRELRDQGYNMSLGGGVNIAREPRNGRTFEYMGEDPVLAGSMVAQLIQGTSSEHVISDIKHYALNDQESGRNAVNVNIDKRSMRESDLLAFEIGVRHGNPAAVMCSYNRVNGDYACENSYLLTDVLKKDWNYKGFVLSDWGGTHSVEKASAAGLDHEQPGEYFYGDALKKAVQSGKVPAAQLDDHVHRVLRSMFASGVVDDPPHRSVVDVARGFEITQHIAEQSIVLLKNDGNQLPLDASKLSHIAVIGAHSDVGMISGGGSAQVDPPGGNAIMPPGKGRTSWQAEIWFPTSPLRAIKAKVPHATVDYDPGTDLPAAAALAKSAEVAIVFAYQWESEGMDLETLTLAHNQDALIAQVAAANPHTIVVLETGSPATMPWVDQVSGILEAWYPGTRGAEALANLLFGELNPSAKLPITFPKSDADLPHPTVVKPPKESIADDSKPDHWKRVLEGLPAFQVTHNEGLKVGYKWYDAEHKPVLFPFGYGLSYTTYAYSNLKVTPGAQVRVSFTVQNTGNRDGAEIAQVYAALPASAAEPPKRLVGWNKVQLKAGESKEVSVEIDPLYLSIFNVDNNAWQRLPGDYTVLVGGSSQSLPLQESITLP
jgi:beta-glucosidase